MTASQPALLPPPDESPYAPLPDELALPAAAADRSESDSSEPSGAESAPGHEPFEEMSEEPDEPLPETLPQGPPSTDTRPTWIERIQNEHRLPAALRQSLAAAIDKSGHAEATEEPQLTLTQVAQVFAEAVPSLLSRELVVPAPHPAGEGFFQQSALSDDDAARLAREQLERTGFQPRP